MRMPSTLLFILVSGIGFVALANSDELSLTDETECDLGHKTICARSQRKRN